MIGERMMVGVVLERRRLDDPWRDHVWHALEVVPGMAELPEWRKLAEDANGVRWLAAVLPIEMFPKETDGYRMNVTGESPSVFVVLRPDAEGGAGREMKVFHATVCPFEAGNYGQNGAETVDALPMPIEIRAWVEAFVARHHVEQPFRKRQRDRLDPDKIGFGRGVPNKDGGGGRGHD